MQPIYINSSYRALIPQQQNNAATIAANFDEENTIDNDLNMHNHKVKNLSSTTDLTDAVNLQQVYDINSTYFNNMNVPTSKVYADVDLNLGSNYTVKSSIPTTDDGMINKYYIDHMTFPFSRLSGQLGASQIPDNSIPGSKIQTVDFISQVANKPTTYNSKTSTTTVDSSIDLLNTYKVVNNPNPTNAQDLVTL